MKLILAAATLSMALHAQVASGIINWKGGATDSTGLNRCGKACRVPSSR
jgi:hypothetical protein